MAELHIIGQIVSGSGYTENSLLCKWGATFGGAWRLLQGQVEGQTQANVSEIDNAAYFSHPIDMHFSTRSIQGWPSIRLEVFHRDSYGRQYIAGYGVCQVPTQPGEHECDVATWRPSGSLREEVVRAFVGGGLQLRNPDSVFAPLDRYRLVTSAAGTIHLRLGVIVRNFDKFGIDF